MKKGIKILCIILGIIIVFGLIFLTVYYNKTKNNSIATMSAIVVKVNENSLGVMNIENTDELLTVGYADEGNIGFKQGQEILIYYDGMVLASFPAQIYNVGKIEIVKEESETAIPEKVLRYYYSSRDNVTVSISELTKAGITLTITDKNEIPYSYSNNYIIYKKVKNEDYTGIGYKIGEDTENSTAGYTRNRCRIYMGRSRKKFRYFK